MAPSGDLAHNPGMCPDWESNWVPFGLQPALNPLSYTTQGSNLFKWGDYSSWDIHSFAWSPSVITNCIPICSFLFSSLDDKFFGHPVYLDRICNFLLTVLNPLELPIFSKNPQMQKSKIYLHFRMKRMIPYATYLHILNHSMLVYITKFMP